MPRSAAVPGIGVEPPPGVFIVIEENLNASSLPPRAPAATKYRPFRFALYPVPPLNCVGQVGPVLGSQSLTLENDIFVQPALINWLMVLPVRSYAPVSDSGAMKKSMSVLANCFQPILKSVGAITSA